MTRSCATVVLFAAVTYVLGIPPVNSSPSCDEVLQDLTEQLRSSVELDRMIAASALAALGARAEPATSFLLSALRDASPLVRGEAASALGQIGGGGSEVTLALESTLGDTDCFVARRAGEALGRLSGGDRAAFAALSKAVVSRSDRVRAASRAGLSFTGPTVAEIIPLLVDQLRSAEEWEQLEVIRALAKLGSHARRASPALTDALLDGGVELQLEAAWALAEIGCGSDRELRVLDSCASGRTVPVRAACALALFRAGRCTPEAVTRLLVLSAGQRGERVRALRALATLGRGAVAAVPWIIARLNEWDSFMQSEAITALASIAADSDAVIATLSRLAVEADSEVRESAAQSMHLVRERRGAVIPLLLDLAKDDDEEVVIAALQSLASFGPAAVDAMPSLLKLFPMTAGRCRLRVTLIRTYAGIDCAAEPVLELLREVSADERECRDVRAAAQDALREIKRE